MVLLLQQLFLLICFSPIVAVVGANDEKWALNMVRNIYWNLSKSYMAERIVDARGSMHLGDPSPPGYEDTKMSYFYNTDSDNMLIKFKMYNDTGAAYCEIGVIPDAALESFENDNLASWNKQCTFQRQNVYKYDGDVVNRERRTAFCPITGAIDWKIADCTYNQPSKQPQCLSEFHKAASDDQQMFEYDLLRLCAKAYFFNGKNYNDPRRLLKSRKNWLLYLAKGRLTCGIGSESDAETGKQMLAHGYSVDLVHLFDYERDWDYPEMRTCPQLEATLVAYQGKDPEGNFFLAAVVGAGQLDGHFDWEDNSRKQFWNEKTFLNDYAKMNLDERICYLNYHKRLRNRHSGRYRLELRVTHHCTGRAMRETIPFDVSIGPEQTGPDAIYEDTDITIDLAKHELKRSTNMTLSKAGPYILTYGETKLDAVCKHDGDCLRGTRCTYSSDKTCSKPQNKNGTVCKRVKSGWPQEQRCGFCVCKLSEAHVDSKGKWHPRQEGSHRLGCEQDSDCADREFCARHVSKVATEWECKKMRFKEPGEPCWTTTECFPWFDCSKAPDAWGNCRSRLKNQTGGGN